MSRLTIDVTDQQHQALKAMAALAGKTIKQFVLEKLLPDTSKEEQALRELKALLVERVAEAGRGELVADSITDVAKAELRNHTV
jgi:hypothetical protein